MNGECSFKEGLEARLKIASPTLADLEKFCQKYCPSDFSAGMEDLVAELHKSGHEVFILSGGFRDLILPFARYEESDLSCLSARNGEGNLCLNI